MPKSMKKNNLKSILYNKCYNFFRDEEFKRQNTYAKNFINKHIEYFNNSSAYIETLAAVVCFFTLNKNSTEYFTQRMISHYFDISASGISNAIDNFYAYLSKKELEKIDNTLNKCIKN